jgi:hypothetical protein
MKKISPKSLAFTAETIRALDAAHLVAVVGGLSILNCRSIDLACVPTIQITNCAVCHTENCTFE